MANPPRADDGVTQAVRRVRLAAGSLAGPLDVFAVVAAAAQALPDALNPALEKLAPSPFAGLGGLLGTLKIQEPSGGSAAAGRSNTRRPPTRAAATGAAPAGAAAVPAPT